MTAQRQTTTWTRDPATLRKYFDEKTPDRPESGCWLWKGEVANKYRGCVYGRVRLQVRPTRSITAHRLSYELAHGPIPDGAVVRHACDTPMCVNPAHLLVGSHDDNMRDMVERSRQAKGLRVVRRNATLNAAKAYEIKRRWMAGGVTGKSLAVEFGVSKATISEILTGTIWCFPEATPDGFVPRQKQEKKRGARSVGAGD